MSTLESEIYKRTGVSISRIPTDGLSRRFVVGRAEWYALSFGDCGSFGCMATGELYGWDNGGRYRISATEQPERFNRDQLRIEKEIVEFCNRLQDEGASMSDADTARYILALKRLIDHKRYTYDGKQR